MIDKKSRRVVIINNIQSDTIDQAIFILKTDKSDKHTFKSDTNIASEAQTIINNYIRQVERFKSTSSNNDSKSHRLPVWLKVLLTTGVLIFLTYFAIQIR